VALHNGRQGNYCHGCRLDKNDSPKSFQSGNKEETQYPGDVNLSEIDGCGNRAAFPYGRKKTRDKQPADQDERPTLKRRDSDSGSSSSSSGNNN